MEVGLFRERFWEEEGRRFAYGNASLTATLRLGRRAESSGKTRFVSYKEVIGWQKGIDLVVAIYTFTEKLPNSEKFNLISQLQRASVSIPSNIAERYVRNSKVDYARFTDIALGSTREVQTRLEICSRLGMGDTTNLLKMADDVARILLALSRSLRSSP